MTTTLLWILAITAVGISGCAWNWKSVRERQLEAELGQAQNRLTESEASRQALLAQVGQLQENLDRSQDERAREIRELVEEKEAAARRAAQEKEQEGQELLAAQRRLAESLKRELSDARAKLEMTERGLVLTFLDEIFFDSGKAVIKPEGESALKKVAEVLQETVPDSPVAVEGHTDNEPIRYSGWRSNWELSAHRALAVVHYFVDQEKLPAQRLRAIGYGEFHSVADNDTSEGRRQNRRVEVVILPASLRKEKPIPLAPSE